MFQFWYLFLHDAGTFAITLFILFIVAVFGCAIYYASKI